MLGILCIDLDSWLQVTETESKKFKYKRVLYFKDAGFLPEPKGRDIIKVYEGVPQLPRISLISVALFKCLSPSLHGYSFSLLLVYMMGNGSLRV